MDLYSIGEMVIDFIPGEEEHSYVRNAGGAPANVAIALSRNGLKSGFCGKVGNDDFGKFLINTLEENEVSVLCKELTNEAITTMAFVTLREDGERTFIFARKPGADMMLQVTDVNENDIINSKIIHAGSCSLSKQPASDATIHALKLARENDKLVSFDVNYRDLMWDDDMEAATKKVLEILPYVDLLKISEEEVDMLGGEDNIINVMKENDIAIVVETLGSKGSKCFYGNRTISVMGRKADSVDATGAGDAFWGGFLSNLLMQGVNSVESLSDNVITRALEYGNVSGWICVQKKGAIASLPTRAEIEKYL